MRGVRMRVMPAGRRHGCSAGARYRPTRLAACRSPQGSRSTDRVPRPPPAVRIRSTFWFAYSEPACRLVVSARHRVAAGGQAPAALAPRGLPARHAGHLRGTQTRFLYLAEHEFFLKRIQHVVMHHLGPFLVALGLAAGPLRRGMPAPLARVIGSKPVRRLIAPAQQPVIAAAIFVGLVGLWLIPPIHLRAMVGHRLFWIMNWSMILDGLLFWCLVLDPQTTAAGADRLFCSRGDGLRCHLPADPDRRADRLLGPRPLSVLRLLRLVLPDDQPAVRSTRRRHGDLDSAGDDERHRIDHGPQSLAAARGGSRAAPRPCGCAAQRAIGTLDVGPRAAFP